jgi:hypothetical protein
MLLTIQTPDMCWISTYKCNNNNNDNDDDNNDSNNKTMPKDSRSICSKRLEAMNGELWEPGKPSYTKPYCSTWGFATMDPIFPSYSLDSDGETEQTTKPTKCN